jgi:4-amino-4-deoxy-L-arabinose transferase-like glycosyltransferase
VPISRDELRSILVLAVLCVFLFFFGLANFGLLGADEPRYAQIGREMLERNDWVTPRLHGEVWLEKPVLYYWLEILSYKLFGVSDWAARLPAAVLAAILIAAIYVFIGRFRPGARMEASVITASSIAIFGFARGASTDMPLAVFFTLALLAWWVFVETGQRNWLLVFYFCMALATLAKGPVAVVLAGLVMGVFAIVTRDLKVIARTLWLPGIALFCVLALPWYVLVQLRNPQFFSEFILRHNLARFSTDVFRHTRPFWYFVPVLLIGLLPWTTFGLAGAMQALRSWRAGRAHYTLFLLLWGVLPIVFFSLSQSKLPGYILPAIPAWTLLAVEYSQSRFREQKTIPIALLLTHGLVSALMVGAVALLPRFMLDRNARLSGSVVLVTAGVAALAFLFVAGLSLWRGMRLLRFATLIPLLICIAYVLRIAAPVVDATQSARPVANSLAGVTTPIAVFKVSRSLEYGLGFYRNQPIARYEQGEVPEHDHFLLAKKGQEAELAATFVRQQGKHPADAPSNTPGTKGKCEDGPETRDELRPVGEFKPQGIDYYEVRRAVAAPCETPSDTSIRR